MQTKRIDQYDKITGWIVFVISAVIFLYTLRRAFLLSFTWDESYSYLEFIRNGIFIPDKYSTMSANNHLLNTWLNILFIKSLGISEFVLRLPSLGSHLLFLFFSYRLVKHFENKWLVVASFLIINLNPYMLDFFSLSRGYGLSFGLLMASIYYLYLFFKSGGDLKYSVLTFIFAVLATLANMVLLNYMAALLMVIIFFSARMSVELAGGGMKKLFLFFRLSAFPGLIFLISSLFIVPYAFKLKEAGALFYGGNRGFWSDTICTVIDRCFYEQDYGNLLQRATKMMVIVVIAGTMIFSIRNFLKKKSGKNSLFLLSLLGLICFCSVFIIVQHHVTGTLYLIDRTAIFLVILLNVLLVFFIDEHVGRIKPLLILGYCVAAGTVIHFILSLNFHYVLEWKLDSDLKEMISDLKNAHIIPGEKKNINISIPLEFDPSINFYRAKDHLTWINTVERSDPGDLRYDYFFIRNDELSKFSRDSLEFIKTYPATKNVLAKRKFPPTIIRTLIKDSIGFSNQERILKADQEYSKGFDYLLPDTLVSNKNAEVVIEASLMTRDAIKGDVYLVISFENKRGMYLWKKASVKDYFLRNNEWTDIYFTCLVPLEVGQNDRLKSYLWNPNGTELYIRQMKLKWIGKSQ